MWKYILRLFGFKKIHYVRKIDGYVTTTEFINTLHSETSHSKYYKQINKRQVKLYKTSFNNNQNYYIKLIENPLDVYESFKFETDFDIYYVF